MEFNYDLHADDIRPRNEDVELTINLIGPYALVLRVLDAARLAFESAAADNDRYIAGLLDAL